MEKKNRITTRIPGKYKKQSKTGRDYFSVPHSTLRHCFLDRTANDEIMFAQILMLIHAIPYNQIILIVMYKE